MPKDKKNLKIGTNPSSNFGLNLPIEILSYIFQCLSYTDRTSLTRCCRVSKGFSKIASPVLYRRIGISDNPSRDSRLDCSFERLTANGKENSNTRKRKLLKSSTHVRIDAHHLSTICNRGKKTISFPNLKVLTLCLTLNSFGPILHIDGRDEYPGLASTITQSNTGQTTSTTIDSTRCSLLKSLKPKHKLVIDGCNLTNIVGFPIGFPSTIYDGIKELTLICPSIDFLPEALVGGLPKWSYTNLKRINWIFFTPNNQTYWKLGTTKLSYSMGNKQINNGKLQTEYWSFSKFLLSFPPDIEISIINSGLIHPDCLDSPSSKEDFIQFLFSAKVRDSMIHETELTLNSTLKTIHQDNIVERQEVYDRHQTEIQKAKERWESIKWIGMKEYLENNDWEGELDPDEVKAWLR